MSKWTCFLCGGAKGEVGERCPVTSDGLHQWLRDWEYDLFPTVAEVADFVEALSPYDIGRMLHEGEIGFVGGTDVIGGKQFAVYADPITRRVWLGTSNGEDIGQGDDWVEVEYPVSLPEVPTTVRIYHEDLREMVEVDLADRRTWPAWIFLDAVGADAMLCDDYATLAAVNQAKAAIR